MRPIVFLGLCLSLVGLALAYGPIFLPREWFGELGHGDGMGLIGLSMFGFIAAGMGAIILAGAAVAHFASRKNSK